MAKRLAILLLITIFAGYESLFGRLSYPIEGQQGISRNAIPFIFNSNFIGGRMRNRVAIPNLTILMIIISLFLPFGVLASNPNINFEQYVISESVLNSVAVSAADMNNDGNVDILSGDRVNHWFYLFLNDGNQNFTPVIIDTYNAIYSIAVQDIDQDGDKDIAVNGDIGGYQLFWYENDGNLVFTRHLLFQYGLDPSYVSIIDMDRDGDLDLFANANGWSQAYTYWFENDGNQNFTSHEILNLYSPLNGGCQRSAVADVDSDGDPDIVEACQGSPVFWLENDGNQSFTRLDISRILDSSYNVQSIDMDYDGDIDVLVSDLNDGTIWFENDGTQQFIEHRISSNRILIGTVWAVDIENDGDMDVVEAVYGLNQLSLWVNQGDMNFIETIVADNLNPWVVFVTDLNQDGNEDIIVEESFVGKLSWFEQQPVDEQLILTNLSPAKIWVGLKNSDDVGTKFDLLADVYQDGSKIGSGQLDKVNGGSSGFNNAKLNTIPLTLFAPVNWTAGLTLNIKLSVRNTCFGNTHNSGTARLWYNDGAANSQFSATIDDVSQNYFLRDSFILGITPGSGPKKTIDIPAGAPCSSFKLFGTWSITP